MDESLSFSPVILQMPEPGLATAATPSRLAIGMRYTFPSK